MSASRMVFNVLVGKDTGTGEWVAHCLELDIVADGTSRDEAQNNLLDLIEAQFDYAITHDNMEHFFRPAPQELWEKFFACKERVEQERKFTSRLGFKGPTPEMFVTTTCSSDELCYVGG